MAMATIMATAATANNHTKSWMTNDYPPPSSLDISRRDGRIDALKGLLILLVVLGHIMEARWGCHPVNQIVYLIIYSFHMPLFVLLAGYTFNRRSSGRKLLRTSALLLESYIAFQIINAMIYGYSVESSPLRSLLIPGYAMWFLLSLVAWRAMTYFLLKRDMLMQRFAPIFVASLLFSVLVGFAPVNTRIPFMRTFVFFPFFLLGFYFRNFRVITFSTARLTASLVLLWAGMFLLLKSQGLILLNLSHTFRGSVPYECGVYIPLRILSLAAAFAVCILIFTKFRTVGVLEKTGFISLPIYLIHIPIIRLFPMVLDNGGLIYNIAIPTALTAGIVLTIYLLSKTPCLRFILNPISTVFENLSLNPANSKPQKEA